MTVALGVFLVLLVGVLHWLTPSLTPPTVPFGVRIPAERGVAPVIAEQRRRFRIATAVLTVVCAVVPILTVWWPLVIVVQLAVGTVLYLRARSAISAVKARENWFGGRRQVTVADTALRSSPEPFAWPSLIAPVLVIVATVVIGIAKYPTLPDRLPTHFAVDGTPDQFAAKSVAVAFAPVVAQVFVTALIGGLAYAVLRIRARLDAEDPDASTRHRRFVSVMSRALLFLAACVNLTFLIVALQIWGIYQPKGSAALIEAAPALVGIVVVTAAAVRVGQEGSRVGIPAAHAPGEPVNRDDDRLYRWGLFYYNPDDPAIFAPKRFGVGWTVNVARGATWGMVLAGLAIVTVIALLAGCSSTPTPKPPATHDLTFHSGPDTLPATFQPATTGSGPRPGALIISGSGPTDRNGNDPQLPHLDTNRNFASALAAGGVASLRYDKIGSGQAGLGAHPGGTGIDFDLYAQETLDAYRTLAKQDGVDPHRLVVVGHSEGGLFALWLADRLKGTPEAPRAVVLAAPLGVRYLDVLDRQLTDQYRAAHLSPQQLSARLGGLHAVIASIRTSGTLPATPIDPALKSVFNPVNVPFLRQADRQDPAQLAHSLGPAFPALVLRGTKDVQVDAGDIRHLMTGFQADRAADETDIPDADHLFKVVPGTPNPSVDYPDATRPFAPQVAPRLDTFLSGALT